MPGWTFSLGGEWQTEEPGRWKRRLWRSTWRARLAQLGALGDHAGANEFQRGERLVFALSTGDVSELVGGGLNNGLRLG